jgi:hypothetical protein
LVLGCTFAWIANRVRHNGAQRRAVERIWRVGGHVAFDGESVMVRPLSKADWSAETGKTWIYDALVDRTPTQILFAHAVNYPTDVTDDDVDELIAAIRQLPTVVAVRLDATAVSRKGVERMQAELPRVRIEKPGVNWP